MIKDRIRKAIGTGDRNFSEIISHSSSALIILVTAAGIQFVFDFFMAKNFGAEGTGIFYICFSVVITLSILSTLGLDKAVVKIIPPLLVKEKSKEGTAALYAAARLVMGSAVLTSLVFFMLSPWLATSVFHKSELTPYLRIFSIAITPFSLRYLFSGVLKSLKRTNEALVVERVLVFLVGIVAIFSLGVVFDLHGLVLGFVIGCFVSATAGLLYTRAYFPRKRPVRRYSNRLLLASGLPLLFVSFSNQLNGQVGTLILGSVGSASDVGVYNVAFKTATVLALALTAINSIAGTTISELSSANKVNELRTLIRKTSSLAFILALPVFMTFIFFPEFILNIFGSEFISGINTLRILALGMFINVSVGPTIFILAMSGNEKPLAKIVGASVVINIAIGLVVIPRMGVAGAALSTALSSSFSNIVMLFFIKRRLGVWSLPFQYLGIWTGIKKRKS